MTTHANHIDNAGASATSRRVPLQDAALRLHGSDDVVIAKHALQAGTTLHWEEGRNRQEITLPHPIPSGHKLALAEIPADAPVLRYGQVIGFATQRIRPGEHVHTHNLGLRNFRRNHAPGAEAPPLTLVPHEERRTFLGYRRPDGRVGTRNTIAVIATVTCAAHACRAIARHFTPGRLAPYEHVDGVFALTHHGGCAQRPGGPDLTLLQRTLCGIARHPNVGGCILVGLGCETNQIDDLAAQCGFAGSGGPPRLVIQDRGGIARTVQAGIATVEGMLPEVNAAQRTRVSISELAVALQCGGSDAWSGVTANPIVGLVSDEIVRQGGTVVLAETPEILGAEHLLTRRAASPAVGQRLLTLVEWWIERAQRLGIDLDDNRSVGNEAGGLTTIYEKALGGVAKGGSTPLTAVYDYAEPVAARGLAFMNTPGFDPVSVTGQIAGGCNLVLFTTGRGSVSGSLPAPTVKISTNSRTYRRMEDDMDFDAGRVLKGMPMAEAARDLLDLLVAVASGRRTKSERQGVGEAEFSPWNLGGIL
jgi:altronate dehydratase